MQLLNEDLLRLVRARSVAPEEAFDRAMDKDDMRNRLRTAGFSA